MVPLYVSSASSLNDRESEQHLRYAQTDKEEGRLDDPDFQHQRDCELKQHRDPVGQPGTIGYYRERRTESYILAKPNPHPVAIDLNLCSGISVR